LTPAPSTSQDQEQTAALEQPSASQEQEEPSLDDLCHVTIRKARGAAAANLAQQAERMVKTQEKSH
jgi:hypothetical protein